MCADAAIYLYLRCFNVVFAVYHKCADAAIYLYLRCFNVVFAAYHMCAAAAIYLHFSTVFYIFIYSYSEQYYI